MDTEHLSETLTKLNNSLDPKNVSKKSNSETLLQLEVHRRICVIGVTETEPKENRGRKQTLRLKCARYCKMMGGKNIVPSNRCMITKSTKGPFNLIQSQFSNLAYDAYLLLTTMR